MAAFANDNDENQEYIASEIDRAYRFAQSQINIVKKHAKPAEIIKLEKNLEKEKQELLSLAQEVKVGSEKKNLAEAKRLGTELKLALDTAHEYKLAGDKDRMAASVSKAIRAYQKAHILAYKSQVQITLKKVVRRGLKVDNVVVWIPSLIAALQAPHIFGPYSLIPSLILSSGLAVGLGGAIRLVGDNGIRTMGQPAPVDTQLLQSFWYEAGAPADLRQSEVWFSGSIQAQLGPSACEYWLAGDKS